MRAAVVRKLAITALLFAVFAAPASAGRVSLMPGVTYERQVQFTPRGPVVVHIMRAPRPGGLYALRPLLSNDSLLGRETVPSMQKRASASATVAGVNGDFWTWDEGLPTGMLMQSGVLETPPHPRRSSLGITDDGSLLVERVTMLGQWQGLGPRRALNGLNQRPSAQAISLFTPVWGESTPSAQGTVEAVLQPFPPAAPATDLHGLVTEIKNGGGTPIPRDGAVLVARGSAASRLVAEAAVGQELLVRLVLRPNWAAVVDAIGGGPVIVRNGQPVYNAVEEFSSSQIFARDPRTGVGQLANGRLVFVAVDGRQRGYSVGVTNFELAQLLVRLGAVTATALDSGGSTTMAFNGKLLNQPSDPGGVRAVGDALTLFYYGVVAPPATSPVLSPNGDGVAEIQALSYKIVRPSTVTSSLVGPNGVTRLTETQLRDPGSYRFGWTGSGRARRTLALGRERRRRPGPAVDRHPNLLPEQHARLPERQAPPGRRPPPRRVAPGSLPARASGGRDAFDQDRERDAGEDHSPAPRRRAPKHSLERLLRQRSPGFLGPVLGPGSGRECVRPLGARAPLPRSARPPLGGSSACCSSPGGEQRGPAAQSICARSS